MIPTRRTIIIAGLLMVAASANTLAQTAQSSVRGSIISLDGAMLTVATREGPTEKVVLPDGFKPGALKRMAMSDIKADTFVATVATPQPDGTLVASYLQILPDSLRGTAQGHYDWDLAPGSTMTNAIVSSMVSANSGEKLTMAYKGTPIDIVVPVGVPIIMGIPAEMSDLKPGAKVFARGVRNADGTFTVQRVTVSKDGIDPPQ